MPDAGPEGENIIDGVVARVSFAVALAAAMLVAATLWFGYRDAIAQARVTADGLSYGLQRALEGLVGRIDLSLSMVVDATGRFPDGAVEPDSPDGLIRRLKETMPEIQALQVTDAAGRVIHGSSDIASGLIAIADRDYFIRLRDDPDAGLVVSVPLRGRISDLWSVVFARRLTGADGSFKGVVLAAAPLERFRALLSGLDAGPSGTLGVRGSDYSLIIRVPGAPRDANPLSYLAGTRDFEAAVAARPDGGVYRARTGPDGVDRILAYRRLHGVPMFVIVGLAVDDQLAAWRDQGLVLTTGGLLFLLLVAGCCRGLRRTLRRQAERSLATRRELDATRSLLDLTPAGVALLGSDRRPVAMNRAFAALLGDPSGAVPDSGPVAAGPFPSPKSRRILEGLCRRAYPAMLSGAMFSDTVPGRGADGRPMRFFVRARLRDPSVPAMGSVWGGWAPEDADGGALTPEFFRALVDKAADCVFVADPCQGFRVIYANDAACACFGTDRDGLSSWRMSDWDLSLAPSGALEEFWQRVREQRAVVVRTRYRMRERAVVPVELSANILTLDGADYLCGSFHDIVGRLSTERALALKAEELERSNAELEQFAYVASHDLREPLRMVTSYLALLELRLGAELTDDLRDFIAQAGDGARRMDCLIRDLLDYSRIGRGALPATPVALSSVMTDVRRILSVRIADCGARLTVAEGLPTISGDRVELVRLFQNLVANALAYRHPGRTPDVRIAARQDRGEWIVSVSDNGIGIEPDHLERIFGIFQRLGPMGTRSDGTGIGLAICRRIIEHHGGRIWVRSTPGSGSDFLVAFVPASPPPSGTPA